MKHSRQLTPNQKMILIALRDHGPHLFISGSGSGNLRITTTKNGERIVVNRGNSEYFLNTRGYLKRVYSATNPERDAIRFELSDAGRERAKTLTDNF